MKKVKKYLSLILILILLLSLMPSCFAASGGAYWHEKKAAASYPSWMAALPNSTPISRVSVPGTHDSMAYSGSCLLRDIILTQTMTLEQQLNSGIRFLDIRLGYLWDHFALFHGPVCVNASFDNVLDTLRTFLRTHPSEFME